MTLDPPDDSSKKTRRHVAAQCCLATFAACLPGGVSTHDAACNGTGSKQPGISAVRH